MRAFGAVFLLAALGTTACSDVDRAASRAGSDAARATSPLVGSWSIAGDAPAPKANLPQFVRLDFAAGGRLDASYVAAGGALAKVVTTPSKLKSEHDTYVLDSGKSLKIVEGSRALTYSYEVDGDKLLLTPDGETQALVYTKD